MHSDFATTMDDQKNLRYKIPLPLKAITGSIASCIYESGSCRYSNADIATTIVMVAVNNTSLASVARSPDSDTVLWRIREGLTFEKAEKLVKTQKPPKGTHIKVLLDGHDKMFYGRDALGLVGTKPKRGTSRAFKYLVAFNSNAPKGIVALREMFDGSVTNDATDMIKELLNDYVIDVVIADGEFYKAEFVDFLSKAKIPFIIRRTNTGNMRELGAKYNAPFFYETDVERAGGRTIHLRYWVYRCKGKDGDFFLVSSMKKDVKKIRKMFSGRWEIETGFREVNRVRIKTTTRDFLVRLFFYIVSCIVYNLWQRIRFRFNLFVVRLDEMVENVISFVKEATFRAADIFGAARRRHVRLRI